MQASAKAGDGLSLDFWKFWTGQAISVLGTSFTGFAVPLLIYRLTGSAVNLAVATASEMLPYLLFGLVIGAWVDRLNRKRLMILVDFGLAGAAAAIPLLATVHHLSVWAIYAMGFVSSTLAIFFNSAEFAAIPSLVRTDDLVTANGRIQATYFGSMVIGPLLAGALSSFIPIPDLLLFDAVSYLISALALSLVDISFNAEGGERKDSAGILGDVLEGLRYVLGHPVLRNISAMMALVNFVSTTTMAQLVLFAKQRFHASNAQVGILFAAGSVGIVLFSLFAGRLRRRWSFSVVALGSLMLSGLFTLVFAVLPWFWPAVLVWTVASGVAGLFNIQTGSLRQAIVPNEMLGRVISIAGVLAWSAIPLGALAGGFAIQRTHNVALVYAVIGVLTFLIPLGFAFTPLGRAEHYLPPAGTTANGLAEAVHG